MATVARSHHVEDARSIELERVGPKAGATAGEPVEYLLQTYDDGTVSAGVWECTPGAFPSRRDGICEHMTFLAGDATIWDEDGTEHRIGPGTSMVVADGWRGRWEIRETLRKTYTIVKVR